MKKLQIRGGGSKVDQHEDFLSDFISDVFLNNNILQEVSIIQFNIC